MNNHEGNKYSRKFNFPSRRPIVIYRLTPVYTRVDIIYRPLDTPCTAPSMISHSWKRARFSSRARNNTTSENVCHIRENNSMNIKGVRATTVLSIQQFIKMESRKSIYDQWKPSSLLKKLNNNAHRKKGLIKEKKKLLQSTWIHVSKSRKRMQRGGIQIDHQGAASESKKESEGRGNKYRVWMVSERPSKRQSRCFLSSFAMPSLRTGLVVTRVQPSSTNKGGRGNDERAEREREKGGTGRSTVLSSIKKRHRPPPGNRCTIPSRIKSKNKIIGKRRNSASTGCPFGGSSR